MIMKCSNCDSLTEIKSFSGELQFRSAEKSMAENVNNGFMKNILEDRFETVYECHNCHTRWRLTAPDFPVGGYFISDRK